MTDAAGPTASADELDHMLQQAFRQRIPAVRVSFLYQLGLAIVAAAMLLLPMLYVALIGLVGYGVWFHATRNITILTLGAPGLVLITAYVGPLVAGAVAAVFMVKPLFAPPHKRLEPQTLLPEEQPLLFRCVNGLCDAMAAPRPRRIDADVQINASAGFRRGILSVVGGDLVLTVGLPLLSDLTVRQFVGVLAHEFGHFTQGTAMRLGYLINSVNGWFARVVYERDAWDERLVRAASTSHSGLITLVIALSQLMVWLSRRLLSVLMWVGHGISCFLSRQMEYNADGYQARVAGSEAVESTHVRLGLLEIAMAKAEQHLNDSWRERRLGDNLPALVELNIRQFSEQPEVMQQVSRAVLGTKTRLFDTHPATKDRVERANRSAQPGIVLSDRPARDLCSDFDELCRSVSLQFYRQVVDESITGSNLVSTDSLLQQQQAIEDAARTLDRYTAGVPVIQLGIFPTWPTSESVPDGSSTLESLQSLRSHLTNRWPELGPALKRFIPSDHRLRQARMGRRLTGAGSIFKTAARKLAGGRSVDDGYDAARRDREARYAEIEDCVNAVRSRFEGALLLARRHQHDEWTKAAPRLESTLAALAQVWARVDALMDSVAELGFIVSIITGNEGDETANEHVSKLLRETYSAMGRIFEALNDLEYPYPHTSGRLSVAQYAMPAVPSTLDPGFLAAADGAVDKLFALYHRVMSDVAVIAERAEIEAGLHQLSFGPEPARTNPTEPPGSNQS